MMGVLIGEWRAGLAWMGRQGLAIFAPLLLVALLLFHFEPGLVFIALAVLWIASGLASGARLWNGAPNDQWWDGALRRPWEYVAGKVMGWAAVAGASLAAVLPLLVVFAARSGMPAGAALQAVVWCFVGGLLTQSVAHSMTWGTGAWGRFAGPALVFVLAGISFQAPSARPWNPVWNLWLLFRDGETDPHVGACVGLSLAATALIWAALIGLWSRRGRTHEPR